MMARHPRPLPTPVIHVRCARMQAPRHAIPNCMQSAMRLVGGHTRRKQSGGVRPVAVVWRTGSGSPCLRSAISLRARYVWTSTHPPTPTPPHHTLEHPHTNTPTPTHPHTHTPTPTHPHTHTPTHTHAHTPTRPHAHTPTPPQWVLGTTVDWGVGVAGASSV